MYRTKCVQILQGTLKTFVGWDEPNINISKDYGT